MKETPLKSLPFLAILLIAGCVTTTPPSYDFDRSATFDADIDSVWQAAVMFFFSQHIDTKIVDKDSGLIVAETDVAVKAGFDNKFASGFAECPSGLLLFPELDRTKLNLLITEDEGGTHVTVNTKFTRQYTAEDMSGPMRHECSSTGVLELTILKYLENNSRPQAKAESEPAPSN